MGKKIIKVLIIDDSALVRQILSKGLALDSSIQVVGTAPDVYVGRDKIIQYKPDVLTLDIEMPKMDGVEFLRRLMPQYPIPVVVVSSLTQRGSKMTFDALDAGAVDFVAKPKADVETGLNSMLMELRSKIKIASGANVSHWKNKRNELVERITKSKKGALSDSTDKVIAIGASTGGTEAIRKVIYQLPYDMPGIVIVQHMPPGFTKSYAERLNELCALEVKEAEHGDRIRQGRVLLAPGAYHMRVVRSGGHYQVHCTKGEKVNGHIPSVEVLMDSVAEHVGPNAYGIMLTGMGNDGAKAMKKMKDAGAYNLAQDEESSVVYGMPKVAAEMGGVDRILPLDDIATALLKLIKN